MLQARSASSAMLYSAHMHAGQGVDTSLPPCRQQHNSQRRAGSQPQRQPTMFTRPQIPTLCTPAALAAQIVTQSWVKGFGLGAIQFTMYGTYAAGLFFGAYRVAAGAYTGGQVLQVLMATLMGGFSLGQVRWRKTLGRTEKVMEIVQDFQHPLVQRDPQPAWQGGVLAREVSQVRRTCEHTLARGQYVRVAANNHSHGGLIAGLQCSQGNWGGGDLRAPAHTWLRAKVVILMVTFPALVLCVPTGGAQPAVLCQGLRRWGPHVPRH